MFSSITCDVCKSGLTGQFIIDDWGFKSHEKHQGIGVDFCFCCGRIISENTSKGFEKTNDGRIICKICLNTSITKSNQAEYQMLRVINLLKKYSFRNIPESINLEILDAHSISEKSKQSLYTVRGLASTNYSISILGTKTILSHTIYMLSHLPKEEFVAVLAHEILHIWLNDNNIMLSDTDTEGFCNLGSYLIYFKNNSKFSNIQLQRMEKDMNPAYGKAYRKLRVELLKYGWKGFLYKIQNEYKN